MNFLIYLLLKIVLIRYQCVKNELKHNLSLIKTSSNSLKEMNKIFNDVCVLKETTDIINNIFGWPILFNISFAVLQLLAYLTRIFLLQFKHYKTAIYVCIVMFWHCVCTL